MDNLLLDIEQYLIFKGLAEGDGIDLFRDYSPPSPDNIIVLTEYAGIQSANSTVCNRMVQVVVRDTDYEQARGKAMRLYHAFDIPEDRILSFTDSRWALVEARQTPFKIGTDENGRILFGFNLSVVTYRD